LGKNRGTLGEELFENESDIGCLSRGTKGGLVKKLKTRDPKKEKRFKLRATLSERSTGS